MLKENGPLPVQEIKRHGGFAREDKFRFDKALTDLQMGLFITMCGAAQRSDKRGGEYGWAATMFSTIEDFWPGETVKKALSITANDAKDAITERIFQLNPNADPKKIKKFIYGN